MPHLIDCKLDTLQATSCVKGLNGQKLNGGSWGEASPDGNEPVSWIEGNNKRGKLEKVKQTSLFCSFRSYLPTPQGKDTIGLDSLDSTINKSIVDLGIGGLIHQRSTNTIERRHRQSHEKASKSGRTETSAEILSWPSSGIDDVSLGNIVHTHLCGIQDAGTHHIRFDSTVEACNALFLVHVSNQGEQGFRFSFVRLSQSFEHIKGVADNTTHTSSEGTSQELQSKAG